MTKFEVVRSCNIAGKMVHRQPDTKRPRNVVELDCKDETIEAAAAAAVEAGHLKVVKKRSRKKAQ